MADKAGMRVLCFWDCFLLTWGHCILVKAEMLSKFWDSWLFQFIAQALWDHLVLFGPGKMLAEKKTNLRLGRIFYLDPVNWGKGVKEKVGKHRRLTVLIWTASDSASDLFQVDPSWVPGSHKRFLSLQNDISFRHISLSTVCELFWNLHSKNSSVLMSLSL